MRCPLAGFHFVPHKDNPDKCHVTMIIEADLKGYIPNYVQKIVFGDMANGMHTVKSLISEYKVKYKSNYEAPIIEQ